MPVGGQDARACLWRASRHQCHSPIPGDDNASPSRRFGLSSLFAFFAIFVFNFFVCFALFVVSLSFDSDTDSDIMEWVNFAGS